MWKVVSQPTIVWGIKNLNVLHSKCTNNPINIPQKHMSTYQSSQNALSTSCQLQSAPDGVIGSSLTSVNWRDIYSGAVCNNHENKESSHRIWCKTNCAEVPAVYFTLSLCCHNRVWANEVFHSCYLDEYWLWRGRAAWIFFYYSLSYSNWLSVPATLPSFTLTLPRSGFPWISQSMVQCGDTGLERAHWHQSVVFTTAGSRTNVHLS